MNALVKSVSISDMLNKRQGIVERLEKIRAMYDEINALGREYFSQGGLLGCADYFINGLNKGRVYSLYENKNEVKIGLEHAIQRVDKAGWKHLLIESGMRTLMNHNMRNEWDNLLYSDEKNVPALDNGTIEATFSKLHADSESIFEQGVIDVFKELSWCYKTNLPQKFGKRIILGWVRSYSGRGSACDKIDDLCRVFCIMDGSTVKDHRMTDGGELARMARAKFSGEHEFSYFKARWFKNGNAHITFTRDDLMIRMNKIIAKHYPNALPAPK